MSGGSGDHDTHGSSATATRPVVFQKMGTASAPTLWTHAQDEVLDRPCCAQLKAPPQSAGGLSEAIEEGEGEVKADQGNNDQKNMRDTDEGEGGGAFQAAGQIQSMLKRECTWEVGR